MRYEEWLCSYMSVAAFVKRPSFLTVYEKTLDICVQFPYLFLQDFVLRKIPLQCYPTNTEAKSVIKALCFAIVSFCHSFRTFPKFSSKTNIPAPRYNCTCAYQGVRNVSFLENLANVGKERSPTVILFLQIFYRSSYALTHFSLESCFI